MCKTLRIRLYNLNVLPDVQGQELEVRRGLGRDEVDLVNVLLLLVDNGDEIVDTEGFEP